MRCCQAHLPRSHVVRVFNMIDAADIAGESHPVSDPTRRALALAGDDAQAKQLVGFTLPRRSCWSIGRAG